MNILQEIRKRRISEVIQKYEKLIDDIFKEVVLPLPDFEDIVNKDGEIITTAEQQKYNYINVRKEAVRNADEMLNSINRLELELHNPEALNKDKNEEDKEATTASKTRKYVRTE